MIGSCRLFPSKLKECSTLCSYGDAAMSVTHNAKKKYVVKARKAKMIFLTLKHSQFRLQTSENVCTEWSRMRNCYSHLLLQFLAPPQVNTHTSRDIYDINFEECRYSENMSEGNISHLLCKC